MALNVKFTIDELPDAKSFTFKDITGDYSVGNTGGWGSPNTGRGDVTSLQIQLTYLSVLYTYNLPDVAESDIIALQSGIELIPTDFGLAGTTFTDGIYQFKVLVNSDLSDAVVEGFAAIVSGRVYNDSLNYRVYIDRKIKDRIIEQNRLLDNMVYSAQVGTVNYFSENLQMLQKLLP